MLSVAFREKKSQRKPVLMLSTNAAAGVSDVRTEAGLMKRKPNCIIDYNKYMGGVDLGDHRIYHVSAERPTRRYWKKIFFNLVDMALLNSYELSVPTPMQLGARVAVISCVLWLRACVVWRSQCWKWQQHELQHRLHSSLRAICSSTGCTAV